MTATWRIIEGDCRDVLRSMPAQSVHTCVTSPPYFGLRDYGTGEWDGGGDCQTCGGTGTDQTDWERLPDCPECRGTGRCDHGAAYVARRQAGRQADVDGGVPGSLRDKPRTVCKCGARRVDRQIGLEPTPAEFVAALVEVFREVRRVLRDDGTVWLNLGDSYAGSQLTRPFKLNEGVDRQAELKPPPSRDVPVGCKPKDLLGVPWMVAFALRADGWYLRSDIIWAKPNPMPESVTDRPTKSHEYVFLLSKGPRYFYDADAIREEAEYGRREWSDVDANLAAVTGARARNATATARASATVSGGDPSAGRNRRSVWTVANTEMMRLRDDLSEADRAYVLGELHARGLLGGT